MRVEIAPVDPGLEIEHPPGLAPQQHHVIQGEQSRGPARAALETRFEQPAWIGGAVSVEHGIDADGDILRHDVGQEPEPPAIDAQQRNFAPDHQARRLQQRAIAADCNHEIGLGGEVGPWHGAHLGAKAPGLVRGDQHRDSAAGEGGQHRHGALGDARFGKVADQGTGLQSGLHAAHLNMPGRGGQRCISARLAGMRPRAGEPGR